jgi:hypothetical protein
MKRLLLVLALFSSAVAQTNDALTINTTQQVTFTATADGTGPMAWQWLKNGSPISGATSSTYVITSAALSDGGVYRARATNSAGSAESNTISINVVTPIAPPRNVVISVLVER